MYKVIKFFRDLKDNSHAYKVGDIFPREGKEVSEARIAELSGICNRQGTPLIEAVPEPEKEPAEEIKEAEVIADEVKPEKEPPKKRGRKKNSN